MRHSNLFTKRGEEIYYRIKPELDKKYRADQVVVIDVNSGDYYIGESATEATLKALKDHPNGIPFFSAFVGSLYGRL